MGSSTNYITPRFLTPLRMEPNRNPKDFSDWDGRSFRLLETLQFVDKTGRLYEIPAGFVFNGATTRLPVEWLPEWVKDILQFFVEMFIRPMGRHAEATAWHDYVYDTPSICIKRTDCDELFKEALHICGCSKFRCWVVREVLRYVGGFSWTKRTYIF